MIDHGCNTEAIFRTRGIGAATRRLVKNNLEIRTIEKRCLRRKKSQREYGKERKWAVRGRKSTAHSRTVRSGGSAVHFEHDLSMLGPRCYT